jgi:Tol biopolymer transport system component
VHLLDVASGEITAFSSGPTDEFEPSWSPDGKSIAFTVDKVRIDVQGLDGARRTVAKVKASADRFNAASVASPAFTPDGQDVVFTAIENGKAELRTAAGVVVQGEDVFPFRASWLPSGEFLYTADGQIKRRTPAGGHDRRLRRRSGADAALHQEEPRLPVDQDPTGCRDRQPGPVADGRRWCSAP